MCGGMGDRLHLHESMTAPTLHHPLDHPTSQCSTNPTPSLVVPQRKMGADYKKQKKLYGGFLHVRARPLCGNRERFLSNFCSRDLTNDQ